MTRAAVAIACNEVFLLLYPASFEVTLRRDLEKLVCSCRADQCWYGLDAGATLVLKYADSSCYIRSRSEVKSLL